MYYKLDPDGNEQQYDFLTKKFKLTQPSSKLGTRGIPHAKKSDIVTKFVPSYAGARTRILEKSPSV